MFFWSAFLLAAIGLPDVAPMEREIAVAAACSVWEDERTSAGPAVHVVGDDGICFFGSTTEANAASFTQAIAESDSTKPLVVVVRSAGGEVTAAMAMAEALVPRTTTVIVQRSCFSSCANYLFLAGDRRVVLPDAVLGYHGGLHAPPEEYWTQTRAEFTAKMTEEEVAASMAASRAYIADGLARQTAFLDSVDADLGFFDWMQAFNMSSKEHQIALCPVENARFYLPSEALLAGQGVVIHSNLGPKSDTELAQVLAERDAAGLVCFWD